MKSSDAKASKCHLKFSSLMMIFIKLVYLSLIKIIIKEENFKWHLEAFASELFMYSTGNKQAQINDQRRREKTIKSFFTHRNLELHFYFILFPRRNKAYILFNGVQETLNGK